MNMFNRLAAVASFALLFLASAGALADSGKSLDPAGGQGDAVAKLVPGTELQTFAASIGWVNQSGSVMNFTVGANGAITGTYVNNAAGTGCRGSAYPLTGWVYGNNIAWSVAWSNAVALCNSVTAWSGYYDTATQQIITSWALAFQSGSGGAIQTGTDIFVYK